MCDLLKQQDPVLDRVVLWLLHQMLIVTTRVPRVEGVEPNDVQTCFRQCGLVVLEESVQVLVVAPRHHQILNAAIGRVHSALGAAR